MKVCKCNARTLSGGCLFANTHSMGEWPCIESSCKQWQEAPIVTWNDAINCMNIDEKARMFERIFDKDCPIRGISEAEHQCDSNSCEKCMITFLASPYDGAKAI